MPHIVIDRQSTNVECICHKITPMKAWIQSYEKYCWYGVLLSAAEVHSMTHRPHKGNLRARKVYDTSVQWLFVS